MARFSADQAYEAWRDGDPIMVERTAAAKIIAQHGETLEHFIEDQPADPEGDIEAWHLLMWLGY